LSEEQKNALLKIEKIFEQKNVILLHGITGSGKTRVYIERIQQALERGEQVLYLLPEIALTTQIVQRLKRIFGDAVGVYHSRLNNNERVELWQQTSQGKPVILGARSALFLPFNNLKLIIVDEEHDPSFKQHDPNPRYHGRDVATYLAMLHEAKVLLGTATPSIESSQNVKTEKYGLVKMQKRFGGISLPEIITIDLKEAQKRKTMRSVFSSVLLKSLEETLERKEQAILFQNRRGYAPRLLCPTCGWHQECAHCDVSLTYHKYQNTLKCHCCGFTTKVSEACPACGVVGLTLKGFGTEKIEDELKIYLPHARIARMDFDTVRSKNRLAQLIHDFEERRLDILVGTQMVTKGLDFDNVSIVGILNADQLLQFPDFRASERAFQLMTQVSGRAGRKQKQGKVLIQTYNPEHPVIQEVINGNFEAFFEREIIERQQFAYPPFVRMIRVTLSHKQARKVNEATRIFEKHLKKALGKAVIGPAIPTVGRVRGYYLLDFLIKLERNANKIKQAKQIIRTLAQQVRAVKGLSSVRVKIDVDPG
ncbi:MAG: primosomal protein N', partial [Bacteroidota bacterium]